MGRVVDAAEREHIVLADGMGVVDIESGGTSATLASHGADIWAIVDAADGRFSATGSADGLVKIWDVPGGGPHR
jgi:WD40 repeat protein